MPLEPVEEQIARAKLIQHFVKAMAIASKALHNDDSYVAYVALKIVVGILVPNAGPESCAEVFEQVLKEELENSPILRSRSRKGTPMNPLDKDPQVKKLLSQAFEFAQRCDALAVEMNLPEPSFPLGVAFLDFFLEKTNPEGYRSSQELVRAAGHIVMKDKGAP